MGNRMIVFLALTGAATVLFAANSLSTGLKAIHFSHDASEAGRYEIYERLHDGAIVLDTASGRFCMVSSTDPGHFPVCSRSPS